jgi:protein disulfide-isomerase A4
MDAGSTMMGHGLLMVSNYSQNTIVSNYFLLGIVKYMLEQSKPAARLLKSAKEVKAFMAQKDVTIIGFFASDSGRLFEAFTEAAERTRGDFTTGYVLEESVRKELKAKVGNIVLYQPEIFQSKYEPKSKTYSPKGSATAEDLLAFWRDNATPLVGQKTRMNAPTRYSQLPLVVVYYSVDFSLQYREGTQFWRNKVVEIANKVFLF